MEPKSNTAGTRRHAFRALVLASMWAAGNALAAPLRIVEPASDATVHSNGGEVAVVVAGAAPDARLRPLVDGRAQGGWGRASRFDLHGIPRGTHRLVVVELDAQGRELARTAPVEFHVWHASRLMRAAR
jgi:hypothetical protein